jgi:hypothetical protein
MLDGKDDGIAMAQETRFLLENETGCHRPFLLPLSSALESKRAAGFRKTSATSRFLW